MLGYCKRPYFQNTARFSTPGHVSERAAFRNGLFRAFRERRSAKPKHERRRPKMHANGRPSRSLLKSFCFSFQFRYISSFHSVRTVYSPDHSPFSIERSDSLRPPAIVKDRHAPAVTPLPSKFGRNPTCNLSVRRKIRLEELISDIRLEELFANRKNRCA